MHIRDSLVLTQLTNGAVVELDGERFVMAHGDLYEGDLCVDGVDSADGSVHLYFREQEWGFRPTVADGDGSPLRPRVKVRCL